MTISERVSRADTGDCQRWTGKVLGCKFGRRWRKRVWHWPPLACFGIGLGHLEVGQELADVSMLV